MKVKGKGSKPNASERLKALEVIAMSHEATLEKFANSIESIFSSFKILTANLEKLIEISGLKDKLEKGLIDDNVANMEKSLETLVEKGALLKVDKEFKIDNRTYVHAREVDEDGVVVNPRIHFAVPTLPEEDAKEMIGRKAGDIIFKSDGSKVGIEVIELFLIASFEKESK